MMFGATAAQELLILDAFTASHSQRIPEAGVR